MALAEITVVGSLGSTSEPALLAAVHKALVTGLSVPEDDPTVLLSDASPKNALLRGKLGRMVLVRVTMFVGRSPATLSKLHAIIATELNAVGIESDEIRTVFIETTVSNWGIAGRPQNVASVGFQIHR